MNHGNTNIERLEEDLYRVRLNNWQCQFVSLTAARDDEFQHLAESLRTNTHLKRLYLVDCVETSVSSLRAVLEAILANHKSGIAGLSIENCPQLPLPAVVDLLRDYPHLVSFQIRQCTWYPSDIDLLTEALAFKITRHDHEPLRILNLGNNRILYNEKEGEDANKDEEEEDLITREDAGASNGKPSRGVQAVDRLCETLGRCPAFENLFLTQWQLLESTLLALVRSMRQYHSKMRSLDLSRNHITPSVAQELARLFSCPREPTEEQFYQPSLKELHLYDCQLSHESLFMLIEALVDNATLLALLMDENATLSVALAQMMEQLLDHNACLRDWSVSYEDGDEGTALAYRRLQKRLAVRANQKDADMKVYARLCQRLAMELCDQLLEAPTSERAQILAYQLRRSDYLLRSFHLPSCFPDNDSGGLSVLWKALRCNDELRSDLLSIWGASSGQSQSSPPPQSN